MKSARVAFPQSITSRDRTNMHYIVLQAKYVPCANIVHGTGFGGTNFVHGQLFWANYVLGQCSHGHSKDVYVLGQCWHGHSKDVHVLGQCWQDRSKDVHVLGQCWHGHARLIPCPGTLGRTRDNVGMQDLFGMQLPLKTLSHASFRPIMSGLTDATSDRLTGLTSGKLRPLPFTNNKWGDYIMDKQHSNFFGRLLWASGFDCRASWC